MKKALLLAASVLVSTCAASVSQAPPVKGTLYLIRPGDGIDTTVLTIRDGVILSTQPKAHLPLRARNRPEITLSRAQMFFGGNHAKNGTLYTDTTTCQPLAISPNGTNVACLRIDGKGTLTLFKLSDPEISQLNTRNTVGEYSTEMMGFLTEDTLAVVADDASCPFYKRADGEYADEPQARLRVIDMHGSLLRSGPCVHGIVVGDGKIAYLTHDPSQNPLYSLDSSTWRPGYPMAFDGSGHLLIIDASGNLVDEQGHVVQPNIAGGYWTK